MIIYSPEKTFEGEWVTIRARIEPRQAVFDWPEYLWFSFPNEYEENLVYHCDAFLVSILLVAMQMGEDLDIRGPVSPRLAYNLEEYQRVLITWFPNLLHHVKVMYQDLKPLTGVKRWNATLFSGGVDSNYTLWKHLPSNQRIEDYVVSHALFIQGQSIPLSDHDTFGAIIKAYKDNFASLGVELVPARTNGRAFYVNKLPYTQFHGPVIFGTAMAIGKMFRRLVIPDSLGYQPKFKLVTSPVINHLVGTDTMEMVHHGAGISRIEKLAAIADQPMFQEGLHVCLQMSKYDGVNNCSECGKCLRTMTYLDILGKLPEFKTFKQPFGKKDIWRWALMFRRKYDYPRETIEYLMKSRQREFLPPAYAAFLVGKLVDLIYYLMPRQGIKMIKKILRASGNKSLYSHRQKPE